jgi:hypothetical protein
MINLVCQGSLQGLDILTVEFFDQIDLHRNGMWNVVVNWEFGVIFSDKPTPVSSLGGLRHDQSSVFVVHYDIG